MMPNPQGREANCPNSHQHSSGGRERHPATSSGNCTLQDRSHSPWALADVLMTERIWTILAASDGNWGSPNTRAELCDEGTPARRTRIAWRMRKATVRDDSRRRHTEVTIRRDPKQWPARDLVNCQFTTDGLNQLWVADMSSSYMPTSSGFICPAMAGDVRTVWAA